MAKLKISSRLKRFLIALLLAIIVGLGASLPLTPPFNEADDTNLPAGNSSPASLALQTLPIKGRAPKTDYSREQFTNDWNPSGACDVRQDILRRDLKNITLAEDGCTVNTGVLNDPYTAEVIIFVRGETTSDDVQIDHVVALSDAWQKGAQQLSYSSRNAFANDPLNLLAVDGAANQQKGDSDAATWLPPNKDFRCSYVARQVAVKKKYNLWVTRPEYEAINKILNTCPEQTLPQ